MAPSTDASRWPPTSGSGPSWSSFWAVRSRTRRAARRMDKSRSRDLLLARTRDATRLGGDTCIGVSAVLRVDVIEAIAARPERARRGGSLGRSHLGECERGARNADSSSIPVEAWRAPPTRARDSVSLSAGRASRQAATLRANGHAILDAPLSGRPIDRWASSAGATRGRPGFRLEACSRGRAPRAERRHRCHAHRLCVPAVSPPHAHCMRSSVAKRLLDLKRLLG
jgi:hypothetical protein